METLPQRSKTCFCWRRRQELYPPFFDILFPLILGRGCEQYGEGLVSYRRYFIGAEGFLFVKALC